MKKKLIIIYILFYISKITYSFNNDSMFVNIKICNKKKVYTYVFSSQNQYSIVSGKICDNLLESNTYLFLMNKKGTVYKTYYDYPGIIKDYLTNKKIFQSNAYIDTTQNGYKLIIIQDGILSQKKIVKVIQIKKSGIIESLPDDTDSIYYHIILKNKNKLKNIEPIIQLTEP